MARLLFKKSAERIPLLGRLGWRLEAGVLALFWLWVRGPDPETASQKGYRLFHRLGPRLSKNRHVLTNLGIAFPHMSEGQRQELARAIWGNFGAVLAEYPHLSAVLEKGSNPRLEVLYRGASKDLVETRRPAVYITPHLANWELAASTISRLGIPLSVIYSPQSNPLIDAMLQKKRESLGVRFITKENAIRQLVREIRSGRSVGLLPDQRIDNGDPVPYFGLEAATTTSPAWLSIKMRCPLIPIEIERLGPASFRAVFHDPLDTGTDTEDTRARLLDTTRRINACFETWIRKHPEHWHCIKRRWPKQATMQTPASAPAEQV